MWAATAAEWQAFVGGNAGPHHPDDRACRWPRRCCCARCAGRKAARLPTKERAAMLLEATGLRHMSGWRFTPSNQKRWYATG